MNDPRFAAAVRPEGDSVVVDLAGDINAFASEELEAATGAALAKGPQRLVLNFTNTSFINSTGIALIVETLRKSRAARVPVVACGLSDHYREIFEITRLVDFMDIAADERAALSATTVFEQEGGRSDA
jgi:anti-anti-sigma factor